MWNVYLYARGSIRHIAYVQSLLQAYAVKRQYSKLGGVDIRPHTKPAPDAEQRRIIDHDYHGLFEDEKLHKTKHHRSIKRAKEASHARHKWEIAHGQTNYDLPTRFA